MVMSTGEKEQKSSEKEEKELVEKSIIERVTERMIENANAHANHSTGA
jgi:hypothetical protein